MLHRNLASRETSTVQVVDLGREATLHFILNNIFQDQIEGSRCESNPTPNPAHVYLVP